MKRSEQLNARQLDEEQWQKLYYKHSQQYIRRRLQAIKYLHEGKTRQEVIDKVGCARQTLIDWIDIYCEGGLPALAQPIKSNRSQRLDVAKKAEIEKMIFERQPIDYGIEQDTWTGKIIIEVVQQQWGIKLKHSRIYKIVKEIEASHDKTHRNLLIR